MERPPSPVPVARVGSRSRAVPAGVALTALLLVLAVLKPWGGSPVGVADHPGRAVPPASPARSTTGSGAAGAMPAGAAPSGGTAAFDSAQAGSTRSGAGSSGTLQPGSVPAGIGACCSTSGPAAPLVVDGMPVCYAPGGWEVVADVPEARFRSRTWIPVTATAATGPADPGIRFARLVAGRVTALGFCAPSDTAPGSMLTASLWQSTVSSRSAVSGRPAGSGSQAGSGPVGFLQVATLRGTGAELGAIAQRAVASPGWPPGRYVLSVRVGPPAGSAAWFGIEIEAPAP